MYIHTHAHARARYTPGGGGRSCSRAVILNEKIGVTTLKGTRRYIAISIDRRRGHSTTNCCSCTRGEEEHRVSVRPQTTSTILYYIYIYGTPEIRYIHLVYSHDSARGNVIINFVGPVVPLKHHLTVIILYSRLRHRMMP